jgi:hypothetical protein
MPGVSVHHQAFRERPTHQIDVSRGLPARYALARRRVVIFFDRVLHKSIIRGTRRRRWINLLIPFHTFVKTKEILKLPQGYELAALIPVGFTAKGAGDPNPREISDFSHRETF